MVATTCDTAEYGLVPANIKHAVHLLTEAHGYAGPVEHMAAVVGWNSGWFPQDLQAKGRQAAALLAEASRLLAEIEEAERASI
jgi:hypothetical protein